MGRMHRRVSTVLWVSAILIAISAVFVFVTAKDPPENSVEWHKQEYLKFFNQRAGKAWSARWSRVWRRITGAAVVPPAQVRNSISPSIELDRHRDALVHMSYLTERIIPLTNAPAQTVLWRAERKAQTLIPKGRMQFTTFSAYHPNGIVVIITAHAEDMAVLETIVRESHMP